MILAQVKAALDALHAKEYETIADYLKNSYTNAFVGSVYTLHQQNVPVIIPIDQSAAIKAVTIDSKLKSDLYTELGIDLTQFKKTIAAEITRGIASGMLYSDMMRNIKSAGGVPLSRARTIVRTEAGRVQEQATFDAAKGAKAKGADVVKQWSAILDGKTRDSHRRLDGQIREINEPFNLGKRKAMHPHDFGVASEDINCRCTMLTRARAALDEDELKILRENAVRHSLYMDDPKAFRAEKLPALKNFQEFKKAYLKAAETVENTGKSGIMVLDLQTFAEKDLSKQKTSSLKKGLASFEEQIAEHRRKIAEPEKYVSGWESKDVREQNGLMKHWQKEISNFQESIDNRIDELKKRGEYDE